MRVDYYFETTATLTEIKTASLKRLHAENSLAETTATLASFDQNILETRLQQSLYLCKHVYPSVPCPLTETFRFPNQEPPNLHCALALNETISIQPARSITGTRTIASGRSSGMASVHSFFSSKKLFLDFWAANFCYLGATPIFGTCSKNHFSYLSRFESTKIP